MPDLTRRQQLEDCFYQDKPFPDDLTEEEKQFVRALSKQWNLTLRDIYKRIMQIDRSSQEMNE